MHLRTKELKSLGETTGPYVSGFLYLENFSQDLVTQLLTVPFATLPCLNTQSCEENPKANPKRGLCRPSPGASRQAESRQHQVMGHDGSFLCVCTALQAPFTSFLWPQGIWESESETESLETANAISWYPEGHKTELTVLLQYCAATVPDPSQLGNVVLYGGTEHIGAYSHIRQDKHRAECASMQAGRAAPSLEQILTTPSQSTVLTISTHLQGFLVLHHTEFHDCHTQSLP